MTYRTVDRITEALAVVCVVAALVALGGQARVPDTERALSDLKVQNIEVRDLEAFHLLVREARGKIDSNMEPGSTLTGLLKDYPGRHEAWAVSARYEESAGRAGPALVSYARAVRLEPDYLDRDSDLYLGGRIVSLLDRTMGKLLKARDRGLSEQEKTQLEAAYYLRRRLAGGCE